MTSYFMSISGMLIKCKDCKMIEVSSMVFKHMLKRWCKT